MRLFLTLGMLTSLAFSQIHLPENFRASFSQSITSTKKKVIHYSGKIRFSNKKQFKWSYVKPTKKEVCTDGLEIMVVDHDLEQVSVYYVSEDLDISKVLAKAKLHSKDIYVAKYQGVQYTIKLDNKKRLQSLAYFDTLDNKVQLAFKHMKYGKGKLSKKSLLCNYPSSYDMIRR